MPEAPGIIEERIKRFINAWETLRPTSTFAGMTLSEFKTRMQPSLDARTHIAGVQAQLAEALSTREDADRASVQLLLLVANAVRGDINEGEDSALYAAMGYVRKSDRKSGLHRLAQTATDATATRRAA